MRADPFTETVLARVPRLPVLFLAVAACSGETSGTDPEPEPDPYRVVFTASPLRDADLVSITPLGSLNPPDHTIPNDHVAFNYLDRCPCDFSPRPVFAPGDGHVRLILRGQDDGIEIGASPDVPGSEQEPWYYMGHVLLSSEIRVGNEITAGQQIGVTGAHALGVDLGVVDSEADNFFVVRDRYHFRTLFGERPLRYFNEPLRSQLYGHVRRQGADKEGRFDYDIAGRLTGAWFHESLPADNRSTGPDGWTRNLAFVYWHEEPDVPVVVVGGTILPPLVYWIANGDPAFDDVDVSDGPVLYRLHIARPDPLSPRIPNYLLMVQLESDNRILVEVFSGTGMPTAFTDRAERYSR